MPDRLPKKTAPPIHDQPARGIFERAYHDETHSVQWGIEADQVIAKLTRFALAEGSSNEAISVLLDEFLEGFNLDSKSKVIYNESVTDLAGFTARIQFAHERLLAPIIFQSPKLYVERKQTTDGAAAKSSELLEPLLAQFDSELNPGRKGELIGAINEQTAIALLNFSQSPSRLAVPGSTVDDRADRTDLYLYRIYKTQRHCGFMYPISVKTSKTAAEEEKRHYINDTVVSASDMLNQDLEVTRLIIRHFEGAPGISDDELLLLRRAEQSLLASIDQQSELSRRKVCGFGFVGGEKLLETFKAPRELGEALRNPTEANRKMRQRFFAFLEK